MLSKMYACTVFSCNSFIRLVVTVKIRDVRDIRFQLAGYPAIFKNPVPAQDPAKMVPGTGYFSQIVIGPFWQLGHL